MEVVRRLIRYRHSDTFRLYSIADIHGGTIHAAEDMAARQFQRIVDDDHALWWDMGDSVECITPSDPRWQHGIIAPWLEKHKGNIAEVERNWYCNLVRKAVDARTPHCGGSRCLGKIKGNHERSLHQHNVADMQKNICDKLDIPNLGFSCMFHLVFQRVNSGEKHMFRFHLTHGSGNAQTPGGRTQKLHKIMNQTTTLYTVVGHMHDIKIEVTPILDTGNSLMLEGRQRIGVISGTYLRTYTQGVEEGYGETRNYDPTSLGAVMFEITPSEERIIPVPVYA